MIGSVCLVCIVVLSEEFIGSTNYWRCVFGLSGCMLDPPSDGRTRDAAQISI